MNVCFQQKYIESYNVDKKLYDEEMARYRFIGIFKYFLQLFWAVVWWFV